MNRIYRSCKLWEWHLAAQLIDSAVALNENDDNYSEIFEEKQEQLVRVNQRRGSDYAVVGEAALKTNGHLGADDGGKPTVEAPQDRMNHYNAVLSSIEDPFHFAQTLKNTSLTFW